MNGSCEKESMLAAAPPLVFRCASRSVILLIGWIWEGEGTVLAREVYVERAA